MIENGIYVVNDWGGWPKEGKPTPILAEHDDSYWGIFEWEVEADIEEKDIICGPMTVDEIIHWYREAKESLR